MITRRTLFVLLPVLFFLESVAQQTDLERFIKLKTTAVTLVELLEEVERQTEWRFSYSPQQISVNTLVTFPTDGLTLQAILAVLQQEHQIHVTVVDKLILLHAVADGSKRMVTVSGTVRDVQSAELLPGAEIFITNTSTGTISNKYGFYSLTLPAESAAKIAIRYVGYQSVMLVVQAARDTTLTISLSSISTMLDTVTITADEIPSVSALATGIHHISSAQIQNIPTLGGEPDPVKALQFLPGVLTSHEGTTSNSVRGGTPDQNLYLLDEATVYNPNHAMSFYSVFNVDALQGMSLYKSAIPLKYGGRLSSVIDIQMREGSRDRQKAAASIGMVASRLTVEGPVGRKKKVSYMISGRYSYLGTMINAITFFNAKSKINFYDFNAKINWRANDRNHFYYSAYAGHDNFFFFDLTNGYSLNWGNKTTTLRWNHVYGPRLFSNTTGVFSNYQYEYHVLNDSRLFNWSASLTEVNIKQDFDFYASNKHHISFGWGAESRWLSPGKITPQLAGSVVRKYTIPQQQSIVLSAYAADEYQLAGTIKAGYGIRYSTLIQVGPYTRYYFKPNDDYPYDSVVTHSGIVQAYHRIDPRAWLSWKLNENQSIIISYDHTTQFLHLLSNSALSLPTDMWMVSGGSIKPQSADNYAIAYSIQSDKKNWKALFSVYDKKMKHITDFKDNANLFANPYVQSQMLQGVGHSYGLEMMAQKEVGKSQGMVSYTLSRTVYQIDGINNDRPFASRSDRRHNVKVNLTRKWSKRLETSLNFIYTSGAPTTIPQGYFPFSTNYSGGGWIPMTFSYYTNRNGYRLPDYHRLDFSVKLHSRKNETRKMKTWWTVDVYNVYARKNPFGLYAQQNRYDLNKVDFRMMYLFGVVPTISYNLAF